MTNWSPALRITILPLLISSIALLAPDLLAQEKTGIFAITRDIGVTQTGSTSYNPTGDLYVVKGGGADMWGSADDFHLSAVEVAGDSVITADVSFPSGPRAPLEKAVLIFRQSLDPGAAYADVAIHGDGHVTLQYRAAGGAKTEDTVSSFHGIANSPTRLRIERHGDQFTVYAGPVGGSLTPSPPVILKLPGRIYAGIGVCAHDAQGLATINFSNVSVQKP